MGYVVHLFERVKTEANILTEEISIRRVCTDHPLCSVTDFVTALGDGICARICGQCCSDISWLTKFINMMTHYLTLYRGGILLTYQNDIRPFWRLP